MAQFWLDQFIRIDYEAMYCCSKAQSQLGPVNIEHNNGDDDGDDDQADDHNIYHDHVGGWVVLVEYKEWL